MRAARGWRLPGRARRRLRGPGPGARPRPAASPDRTFTCGSTVAPGRRVSCRPNPCVRRRRPGRRSGDLRRLRPQPHPAPGGRKVRDVPAGRPRRGREAPGLSPSGPIEARGGKGHSLSRSKPPTSPGSARAGIGFPSAWNPASAPTPEHPRLSAFQGEKSNRIFLASAGSVLLDRIASARSLGPNCTGCLMKDQMQKRLCI